MRVHSTAQSIANREISGLAVSECVLSTAIYVGIGLYLDTFIHLFIAVALGPLFLLRTTFSYNLALANWKKLIDRISLIENGVLGFSILPFVYLIGIALRIASTAAGLIFHPYLSLQGMPDNWVRQALCTDLYYPPEIVPGEAEEDNLPSFTRFVKISSTALAKNWRDPVLLFLADIPIIIIIMSGYLPAIIFRISFKATSIFYLPLVWVVTTTVNSGASLQLRLERITKGELEKFRRRLSAFVLTVTVARLALSAGLVEQEYVEKLVGSPALAARLLDAWPWWHIALSFDAALTFILFLASDALLARLEKGSLTNAHIAEIAVKLMMFLRGLVAALTVAFFVVTAIVATAEHVLTSQALASGSHL